jgi:hypothetical protein
MNKNLKIQIKSKFNFYPVTKDNWKDFENLFGEKGACAGCWCMYWRMLRKEYDASRGSGLKRKMKSIINGVPYREYWPILIMNRLDGVQLHQENTSLSWIIQGC